MLALVYHLKHWAVWTLILVALGCTARPAPQLPIVLTTPAAAAQPPTSTATATRVPTPASTVVPTATPEPTATDTPTTVPPTIEATDAPSSPNAGFDPIGQQAYSVTLALTGANGITRTVGEKYLLYLPGAYGQDPQQQWPLILFMHGSGERGRNVQRVAAAGLPELLTSTLDFPAIVLSPQVPDGQTWNMQLREATALLDHIQANYAVDPKRVYLTGLSLGGFGAWALALRYPRRFAALVPIAGGWDSERDTVPRNICDIKDMPIWVFHGQQDDIVLPKKSELMVNALRKCGSAVRFTLYPDANHRASFERAYQEPDLYTWLFEQHLP